MQSVNALVCVEPGTLELTGAAGAQPSRFGRGSRPPAPGRASAAPTIHIYEGKHPFLKYPRVMGHELAVEVVEAPAGSGPRRSRRDLRRQSVSLLRPLHRLPRRQAQLLRHHLGARRSPGRRHDRASVAAGGQPRSGATAFPPTSAPRSSSLRSARTRCGAAPSTERDKVLVVGAGPIGLGVALFARLAGAEVAVLDRDAGADRGRPAAIAGVDTVPADADPLEAAGLHRRRRVRRRLRRDRQPAGDGERLRLRRPRRTLRAGRRGQGADHVHRPGFPPQGNDALRQPQRHREDFEHVIAAIRDRHVPIDRLITHRTSLAGAVRDIPLWATEKSGLIKALIEID